MFKQTALFLLLVVSFCAQTQNTYYFSNSTGNDTNTGNETSPFQTISKLNIFSILLSFLLIYWNIKKIVIFFINYQINFNL